MGVWPGEGGVAGRERGGSKITKKIFFSNFQKTVIIPKSINLDKNIFEKRGCGRGKGVW